MELGLRGKVVVVTGGSRGIGRAIALGYAEEGCRLSICGRGLPALSSGSTRLDRKSAFVKR